MTARRSARLRREMVEGLAERDVLTDAAVTDAMLDVPREVFVPTVAADQGLQAVYRDVPLVTHRDASGMPVSSSSQPTIMVQMLQMLELRGGDRVLEIGAGTGYNAALLKHLVGGRGRVVTVDIEANFARQARRHLREAGYPARVVAGDGRDGYATGAPYQRVIVTAALRDVPRCWHDQVSQDARLVAPISIAADANHQIVMAFRRTSTGWTSDKATPGGFIQLRPTAQASPPAGSYVGTTWTVNEEVRFVNVEGGGLARLSAARRAQLLTLIAGRPRRRKVRLTANVSTGLALWVAIEAGRRFVHVSRLGFGRMPGVATPRGDGVAVLDIDAGQVTHIEYWGDRTVADHLGRIVEGYRDAGEPGMDRLRIEVAYHDARPRGRRQHRGDATLAFRWNRAAPPHERTA